MNDSRVGILASFTGISISLAGVNEILTAVSLVLGISIGTVSLFRLIKNKKNNHE